MAFLQALRRVVLLTVPPISLSLLVGCGNGNTVTPPPGTTYTVGGAITGLNSDGLVLANGAIRLSVAAGASAFTLPEALLEGADYSVTVVTQPTGLTCSVSHAAGTVQSVNVASVAVTCSENAYSLGGTVAGLTVAGLVLSDGGDRLTVAVNATSFTLPAPVAYSSSYSVTVDMQPKGLTCTVSHGKGAMPASDVASVVVTCADNAYTLGGSITGLTTGGLVLENGNDRRTVAADSTQFTMPTTVAYTSAYAVTVAEQPSGLTCAVSQSTGTMPAADFTGVVVNCAPREWTWMSGPSNTPNVSGVYGVKGTPAAANMPGARNTAVSWSAGNLWLYGGYAYNATGTQGVTDDLWRYSPATGEWTWMGGSSTDFNVAAVYGTRGIAAPDNEPGVRENATSWADAAGNLWLFGGDGLSAAYNDLWKYSPALGEWTWVSGSNSPNAAAVYGTQGVAAAGNMPGSRAQAISWADTAGNFWLFGGTDSNGNALNDLWKYNPSSGEWTWMSGSNTPGAGGVSGTEGISAPANVPGARFRAIAWSDGAGNLWLFGGVGFDSVGGFSVLNDLWRYSPTSGQWAWMSGSNAANANGTYGTQGIAAAGNSPGARYLTVSWTDSIGNLWLFGGYGRDGYGSVGQMNDLWEYSPSLNEWTWVDGASSVYAVSVYGTQGTPAPGNEPGSLQYMVSWVDAVGNFWMFGGYGNAATTDGTLNVLWRY
jgi:N-acetylneuraminic acid mutarotase